MSGTAIGTRTVDLNGAAGGWIQNRIDVQQVQRVHIEVYLRSGAWTTAVLELLKSSSDEDYYSFAPVIEFTGATRIIDVDVHDARYLQLELGTAEGGAGVAIVYLYGDGYDSISTIAAPTYTEGLATRIDEASPTVTYVGKAVPSTATSAATWQIQRLTSTASTLTVEWADGNDEFDNVWDSRAGWSYS